MVNKLTNQLEILYIQVVECGLSKQNKGGEHALPVRLVINTDFVILIGTFCTFVESFLNFDMSLISTQGVLCRQSAMCIFCSVLLQLSSTLFKTPILGPVSFIASNTLPVLTTMERSFTKWAICQPSSNPEISSAYVKQQ